jgi:hypothetical protein
MLTYAFTAPQLFRNPSKAVIKTRPGVSVKPWQFIRKDNLPLSKTYCEIFSAFHRNAARVTCLVCAVNPFCCTLLLTANAVFFPISLPVLFKYSLLSVDIKRGFGIKFSETEIEIEGIQR